MDARLTCDTPACEKRAFFARLRTDPVFLLRHAPALSTAVYRRIRTKLTLLSSKPHRGRKRWPQWVGARGGIAAPVHRSPLTGADLPTYRADVPVPESHAVSEPQAPQHIAPDPEDQFVQHRWGFLLTALLESPVDWHRGIDQCQRWIATNTDRSQRAWEPYSASERVANLAVYLAAMPLELRQQETILEVVRFLDESIDWIYSHLEYYGPVDTNNHILDDARALVIAGVVTGNAVAVGAGVRIFRRWLPELIMSGGFLRERSSHYQLIVLNWLLDSAHFLAVHAQSEGADLEFLREYGSRMLSAASMVCDSRGRLLALIGDVSPDATPSLSRARLALLYPDSWPPPDMTRPAVEIRDGWFRISVGPDVVLGNFPAGDYPARFPTHGHNDFTGFAWRHGATGVLVDSGRYRYTPDPVSAFQASAAGHNLPIVNGLAPVSESVLVHGRWWPRPYAHARLEMFERAGAVLLVHNGYARATSVRRHMRQMAMLDGQLIVTDSFDGQGTVSIAWCWHFGPDFDGFDASQLLASGRLGQVRMLVRGLRGSLRVMPASGTEPGGWTSGSYGSKHAGLAISLHSSVELPAVVSTRFELKLAGEQYP
jgi:Heparinase II/III-like protein